MVVSHCNLPGKRAWASKPYGSARIERFGVHGDCHDGGVGWGRMGRRRSTLRRVSGPMLSRPGCCLSPRA
jgi:hypothetical protein